MADEEQLAILRQGVEAWNESRQATGPMRRDLSGADLRKSTLPNADLSFTNLKSTNLSRSNLSGADFSGASLTHADLTKSRLDKAKFSGADVNLVLLNNAILEEADLSRANFPNSKLNDASLKSANLSETDLRGSQIIKANLNGANLNKAKLQNSDLSNSDLSAANLSEAQLHRTNLKGANLIGANLSGAKLIRTNLSGADLSGADLFETQLTEAHFDAATVLKGAKTSNCVISAYSLEQLNNYGGLTKGNRMDMIIIDDVATLRASYSGFQQWIHLIALLVFVFPYLWFVVSQWLKAEFVSSGSRITLLEGLCRYIYNGGVDWQTGFAFHWSFLAFLYMFVYNIFRAVLLRKTKQLELEQESSGLKAKFSLGGSNWGKVYNVAKWMFYASLAIALLNTIHFFTQTIPIATP